MNAKPDTVVQVLLRSRLRIAAIAVAILRDAHSADDIFQQVVLSALERDGEFLDEGHILAWAVRAARNRAIDVARQRRLRTLPDFVLDRLEARWSDPAESDPADHVRVLHQCLDKLSGAERGLLQLRYDSGLSVVAMSGRLGRKVDALYQSLSRIHRALRKCVQRELMTLADPRCEAQR
jgi:RNA polymerase sigma-70 factor (ECF subfamily)